MNEFSFTLALDVSCLDDSQIRALYKAVVTAIEDIERAAFPRPRYFVADRGLWDTRGCSTTRSSFRRLARDTELTRA